MSEACKVKRSMGVMVIVKPSRSCCRSESQWFSFIKCEFNSYETSMAPSPKVMRLVIDRQETTAMYAPLSASKQCRGVTERVNSMGRGYSGT